MAVHIRIEPVVIPASEIVMAVPLFPMVGKPKSSTDINRDMFGNLNRQAL